MISIIFQKNIVVSIMMTKGIFKINTRIIAISRIKLHIILDLKSSGDKLFRWNEK
ncbi:hypothetical protein PC0204_01080 [Streptococcus pneumoniae]|nr:hypothetical protein PC0204_01080 [Streptococcus pneumoniae]